MKFALNGAVTIGTLDGANIEISEEVGRDNIFIFGLTQEEVTALKSSGYNPAEYIRKSDRLRRVMDLIDKDFFCKDEAGLFKPIYDELTTSDEYMLMADFDSYFNAQTMAEEAYLDKKRWTKMSILNVARCSKFSSDRTIMEYCHDIWGVKSVAVPDCRKPDLF